MEKSKLIELLKGHDQQHVVDYANYITGLYNELDGNRKPVHYYLHSRSEQDMAEAFKKVAKEGMVFDGKHIKMTKSGVSWDYVAFKNKMLKVYPESQIDIELVFDGDKFNYDKIDGKITYRLEVANPFGDKKDDGVIGGFCIIKNKRGEFITRLTKEEIAKHRALAIDSYYWKTWFQEMCKKTVIKKACKEHFEDVFEGVNDMDNENYDMTNSVSLDAKWKNDIDAITNMNDLATYYKANEGQGKEFITYIAKRKKQIMEDKKQLKEATGETEGRLEAIKKEVGGIDTMLALLTLRGRITKEYKDKLPEVLFDEFDKRSDELQKLNGKKEMFDVKTSETGKIYDNSKPKRGRPRKKK